MPIYMYRREDGSTFEVKQKFLDDALQFDPQSGQRVVRLVQPAGIIFKGSGFYVNDSKSASKRNLSSPSTDNGHNADNANGSSADKTSSPSTENGSSADKTTSSSADKTTSSTSTKTAAAD